jgi:predicted permease
VRAFPKLMSSIVRDLRYGLIALLRARGFTAAAVAVLALGIGANSAIFSVVNTVLLRPLPFSGPDRIVEIRHVPPQQAFPGIKTFSVSPANYLDWRSLSKSFAGMAAYTNRQAALTGIGQPEVVKAVFAGGDFFPVVGATPQLGRFFDSNDDQPGGGRVAVLSNGFWQSHFGGDSSALGRTLLINGSPFTIVGVAQPALHLAAWNPGAADVWMPLAWNNELRAERKNHNYLVVARMKPGVTPEQAQAEMNTISSQLEGQYPEANTGWGAKVIPLREFLVGDVRPVLLVLLGAVAFVLLIACANAANLVMARNLGRRREIALRAALGATRGRALQQVFCESLVLAMVGGLAGLALANAGTPLLVNYVSHQFPLDTNSPSDPRVLLFTLAVSLVTGILAGVLPAWRGSKMELADALKLGSRTVSDSGARRTRGLLVSLEVAFSLILLAGAGLMVRSLSLLTGVDPGFNPANVLTLTATPSLDQVPKDEQATRGAAFIDLVVTRVRALPGVAAAGAIDNLPFRGGSIQPFVIEGRPAPAFSQQPTVAVRVITAGYLRTMGIPLLRGKDFDGSEPKNGRQLVLVSESMAKQYWPNEDPIGKRLTLSFNPDKVQEIVGVVGDVKMRGLDVAASQTLYRWEAQAGAFAMSVVVRTAMDPSKLTSAITQTVQNANPNQPVRNVMPMQAIVDESIANRRVSMLLLGAFAVLALVLAAFGLYSVLSYTMRRRLREIGIRLALGASAGDVIRIVMAESLWPTSLGIALGLAGALALTSVLTKLLYGIRPGDPATFCAAAIVLLLVAMAACVVPAWRATRVDPLQVLREE